MEESERRARLRELDDVLDALERLNLKDTSTLPQPLRQQLSEVGVKTAGQSVTELIEQVWAAQEEYLGVSAPGQEQPGAESWRRHRPT
jgi:hypothetical protein